MQLVSVGSSRGESNFHLIFTPKYRRAVFADEEVKRMCLESFAETSFLLDVKIEACEFGPDHVHLFVSRCKNYSVPHMVQRFKGASSHKIRHELWERVKGKLLRKSGRRQPVFWACNKDWSSFVTAAGEGFGTILMHSSR